jgi:septal ring factor EnvC (AmiA/AmiB activator)
MPVLLIFLLWPTLLFADASDPNAQLKTLDKAIDMLQSEIADDTHQQEEIQEILKELDLQIAASSKKIADTKLALNRSTAAIAQLSAQQAEIEQRLMAQENAIAEEARSAFLLGQHDGLKLLLNQNDPHTMGRLMVYFDYFNASRAKAAAALQTDLNLLQDTMLEKEKEQGNLNALQIVEANTLSQLHAQQKTQSALVKKLLASITAKNTQLATLQQDKAALAQVIARLAQYGDNAFNGNADKPIIDHQGKLPWPVQGKVLHQFGDNYLGDTTWEGLFIAAPEGTKVHAVYKGQVVYADWLRGLGLVVIVNHGDDYMSLYAHNQSLYKKVGDTVQVNEAIAQVGKSGTVANPGLYFEMRSKGKVQDPKRWLRSL